MQNVWRINLKSDADEGIDSRMFCINKGILGVGWQVDCEGDIDWETYYQRATDVYYKKGDKGWWPALNAIKNRMSINDLCWTRNLDGIYYVGRISGEWQYKGDKESSEADIVNIRTIEWREAGTVDCVPGKVVNSFIPRRVVQAVDDDSVRQYSAFLFDKLSGKQPNIPLTLDTVDLFSLISAEDCEDLVGLYLQDEKGYRMIPSSCKADTAAYEFVLKHSVTGNNAVVQVKQGYVNLNVEDYTAVLGDVYLFTTKGEYFGDFGKAPRVRCISKGEIEEFIYKRQLVLSDRIKYWLSLLEIIPSIE